MRRSMDKFEKILRGIIRAIIIAIIHEIDEVIEEQGDNLFGLKADKAVRSPEFDECEEAETISGE